MKDLKSCLCCGKVGEPKAWMTNDPSVYVCSRCHRLGNGPEFKATTEEEGDAYTFGFFDGRAEGAKHCDSIQTKYEDAVAQLTKAHNMIDALEKKNVMFRGLLVAALAEIKATGESEGVLFGPDSQIDKKIEQALYKAKEKS